MVSLPSFFIKNQYQNTFRDSCIDRGNYVLTEVVQSYHSNALGNLNTKRHHPNHVVDKEPPSILCARQTQHRSHLLT